jgi:hypothetical protein
MPSNKIDQMKETRGGQIASKLDTAYDTEFGKRLDAHELNEKSAVWLYLDLKERGLIYELPIPGSTDGNNPDIYEGKGVRAKSVLRDFFDSRGRGLECLHDLEEIDKARRGEAAEAFYAAMSQESLKRHHAKVRQRQTRGRAIVKEAVLIHHYMRRIEEDFPGIVLELHKEDDDTYSTAPFYLGTKPDDPNEKPKYRYLSVRQLLAKDLDRIKAEGGVWSQFFPEKPRKEDGQETSVTDNDDYSEDETDSYREGYEQRLSALLDLVEPIREKGTALPLMEDGEIVSYYSKNAEECGPKVVELCGDSEALRRLFKRFAGHVEYAKAFGPFVSPADRIKDKFEYAIRQKLAAE